MIFTNLSESQLKKAIQTKIELHQNKKEIYNEEFFKDIDRKAFHISLVIDEPISIIKNTLLMIKVYAQESKTV
jgi:hypothetical protein